MSTHGTGTTDNTNPLNFPAHVGMALGAAAIYAAAMLTSDEWSQWPQDKRMDMIRTIHNATRVIISSGVQPSDLTSAGKELLKRVHTQR